MGEADDEDDVLAFGPARRRWPSWVVVAAAVVVALGVAVVLVRPGHGNDAVAARPSLVGTPGPGADADPHYARTVATIRRLVATSPVPAHAERADRAPAAELGAPLTTPATDHLVRAVAWWTAPGTDVDVLAFFAAHPWGGLTVTGNGYFETGDDTEVRSIAFSAPSTASSQAVEVDVSVIGTASGVAIRLDAVAVWVPSRTADSMIVDPTSATVSVQVTAFAPAAHDRSVTRVLDAARATALARTVNALPGAVPAFQSCPMAHAQRHDVLVFATRPGAFRVAYFVTGCGSVVTITTPQHRDYPVAFGALPAQVLTVLGLPADYGSR